MNSQRGFTLIEVLVAAAVLGIAATAIFGLFSRSLTNLRTISDLHKYELATEEIMDRVLILGALPAEADVDGRIERLNARWNVKVTPWIPSKLDGNPPVAVMKVNVRVRWQGRSTERSVSLETIKGTPVAYGFNDLKNAIETALPD